MYYLSLLYNCLFHSSLPFFTIYTHLYTHTLPYTNLTTPYINGLSHTICVSLHIQACSYKTHVRSSLYPPRSQSPVSPGHPCCTVGTPPTSISNLLQPALHAPTTVIRLSPLLYVNHLTPIQIRSLLHIPNHFSFSSHDMQPLPRPLSASSALLSLGAPGYVRHHRSDHQAAPAVPPSSDTPSKGNFRPSSPPEGRPITHPFLHAVSPLDKAAPPRAQTSTPSGLPSTRPPLHMVISPCGPPSVRSPSTCPPQPPSTLHAYPFPQLPLHVVTPSR